MTNSNNVIKEEKKASSTKNLKYDDNFFSVNVRPISNTESPQRLPTDFHNKVKNSNKEINDIRGKLINQMICIENCIDTIIASYFTDELNTFIDFKMMILSKSQITTFLKWKLMREIMTDYKYFDKIDKTQLKTDLQEIINTRDDFSHGKIVFDMSNMDPYIEYYRDGVKKRKINQGYLDEFGKKMESVYNILSKIEMNIIKEKYESKE